MPSSTLQRRLTHLFAVVLTALAAGCGGGGGGGGAVAPATQISGTVQNVGGAGRAATATTVAYTDQAAVTTGTLQLVKVTSTGALDSVLVDNIALGAGGAFTVTVPAGQYGSVLVVLSHSAGLRAVVNDTANLRVDPSATLAYEKAKEAGFAGVSTISIKATENSLRTAWQAAPVQVSANDNDPGDLTRLLAGLGNLAVAQNIALTPTSTFCATGTKAFFTTRDGGLGTLSAACLSGTSLTVRNNLTTIHSDASLTYAGGRLYALNRLGADNIQVINPATYQTLNQLSLKETPDDQPNPQALVVVNANKAFVASLAKGSLKIIDPTKSTLATATLGSVDLTPFSAATDTDGSPEPVAMVRVGDRAYVALQRLSNFSAVSNSALVVVDVNTNAVVDADATTAGTQAIELPCKNIFGLQADTAGNKLYLNCSGNFGETGSTVNGIYSVDLANNHATQLILSHATAGFQTGGIIFGSTTRSYVTGFDSSFNTVVRPLNLSTGTLGDPIFSESYTEAIAVDSAGNLWIGDRKTGASGIRVFTSAGTAVNTTPVSTGLSPNFLTFVN